MSWYLLSVSGWGSARLTGPYQIDRLPEPEAQQNTQNNDQVLEPWKMALPDERVVPSRESVHP